jgi:hypothetical protein
VLVAGIALVTAFGKVMTYGVWRLIKLEYSTGKPPAG